MEPYTHYGCLTILELCRSITVFLGYCWLSLVTSELVDHNSEFEV